MVIGAVLLYLFLHALVSFFVALVENKLLIICHSVIYAFTIVLRQISMLMIEFHCSDLMTTAL